MDFTQLFEAIDELQPEYAQFWEDICKIESPTTYKPGVDAVGRFCIEKAETYGWKSIVHKEEVSGDAVCIIMNPDAPGKPICFSGHMDTVHPLGSIPDPVVYRDENHIHGPGAKDCKGGVVASMLAMAALEKIGYRQRPIKLILQSDEENNSVNSQKRTVEFMAKMAEGCEAFLNTEGHIRSKTPNRRKGILRYRFDITGRANHSSRCYNACSAIREAAHIILTMEAFKEKDGLTCNCGKIEGGTAMNVVPDRCTFVVDCRCLTNEQAEQVKKMVENFQKHPYLEESKVCATLISSRVAMEPTEANDDLRNRMNAIYQQAGMPELEVCLNNGGSDVSDMTYLGFPCMDSLGVTGDLSHNPKEYAELSSLAESARRLAVAVAL